MSSPLKLCDEVGTEALIENIEYEDREVHGPAVLQLAGSSNGIEGCNFVEGNLDEVFVSQPTPMRGTIQISGVIFRRCTFWNVAFIGPDALIRPLKAGAQVGP